jgi:putative spermidine/putrescine transport system permease protein
MHSRAVAPPWSELPSSSSRLGWRVVDAAIAARRAGARAIPDAARRTAPLVPALVLVGLLVAGLATLGWRSLHAYDDFLATEGGFSLTQYRTALSDAQFHSVLERTLLMAVVTPLVTLALAVPYALTLTRSRRRWVRLLLLIGMFVPMLTGDITRTYGLLVTLGPNGPLASASSALGLGTPHLLGTLWAIGMGIVQILLPVAVVILLPAVLRIDPELGMAAATMGASPGAVFRRVTLPLLRPAIVAALATDFALAMAAFADPAILGRGLKNFVGNFLQDRYLTLGNPPQGAAIGVLLIAIVSLGTALILAARRGPRRRAGR